ncbi:transcriptional regulator, GntR family [Pseudonocardia thermophila]|uniref:Transcriptional regulator, GntR family n=1 Tax=Pseudonocardia thermophila TaxID=1848 RepID=A0A1M6WRD7_PSETH|nr:FCD domain-containing protein [Pseudonocardia thermophila]SHK96322.1 transcriptional regulator, GntR family [Pseudonocardia thermophila]
MHLAQRIAADINERGHKVGDRLPTAKEMQAEYNVGHGTLREALRYLELQGLISLRTGPQGGPIVRQPDAEALSTTLLLLLQFRRAPYSAVTEVRSALEPVMARLAAERTTDEQLDQIRESVENMERALDEEGPFIAENKRFHKLVAHGSGNDIFGFFIDSMIEILDGSPIGKEYPAARRAAVAKAHRAIYEALASRDPELAAKAMADHVGQSVSYMKGRYAEALAAPITWTIS